MVDLIQYRHRTVTLHAPQGKIGGQPLLEYRQAQVVAGPGGQLLVLTDEDGQVQYGQWQKVPGA